MSRLTEPLVMPEEYVTMPNRLEGMSIDINKVVETNVFLRDIENKGFAFDPVNNNDE
jgi:hypothetical protein